MDINTATAAELQGLPGIGPVLAARIIAARPFTRLEELPRRVTGIGPKRYAALVSSQRLVGLRLRHPVPMTATAITTASQRAQSAPIDINTASEIELQRLQGVGPAIAARIVALRPFFRNDELTAVRGIGAAVYAGFRHQLGDPSLAPDDGARADARGDASDEDGDNDTSSNSPDSASDADHENGEDNDGDDDDQEGGREELCLLARPPPQRAFRCQELLRGVRQSVFLGAAIGGRRLDPPVPMLVGSWNIRNLSRKKDAELLKRVAAVLGEFDVVAVQEVRDTIVLKRLKALLGGGWDYIASPAVGGDSAAPGHLCKRAEHLAFVYRRRVARLLDHPALIVPASTSESMTRPPFVATFDVGTDGAGPPLTLQLVNVHITAGETAHRQREVRTLNEIVAGLNGHVVLVLGDLNLPPHETPALPARMVPLVRPPLTSTVYNKLYDNLWLRSSASQLSHWDVESGVLRVDWAYYPTSRGLQRPLETPASRLRTYTARVQCTRELSDHCPVFAAFARTRSTSLETSVARQELEMVD